MADLRPFTIAVLAGLSLCAAAAAAAPGAELTAQLRAKDQALLDAVAPGNRGLWDRTLTPDALYIDENGGVLDRKAFLEAIVPLPAGLSGSIRITDYQAQQHGDQAFVIMKAEENERYHGVPLVAHYLMTETWRRIGGDWKLGSVHAYVVNPDPPAVTLPSAELDAYVGRYELSPDMHYVIQREGDHLTGATEGRKARELKAELRDVLFVPGSPRSRKLFQREAGGRVTGFIDRREGEDLVWRKLS